MMKSEFIEIAQIENIPDAEYQIIEKVYTFHPAEWDKKKCADVYNSLGMVVFKAMFDDALTAEKMETEIFNLKSKVAEKVEHFTAWKRTILG